tara:strand:+ start:182 stop:556 length:375 start_codon:yes stop_codon:yes gene_type:complete
MNLLGLKKSNKASTLTLDKVNARLKKEVKEKNISLSIIQTHNESKAVSYLHKKRKKYNHIIISPGVWALNGYLIKETLTIMNIPFSIVLSSEYKDSIFHDIISKNNIIIDNEYIDGYLKILQSL